MNCTEATLSLGVYLVGAIDPVERAEVDAHLSDCASCRAELSELAMLPAMLDQLSVEDVEAAGPIPVAPEDLYARVAAQALVEADDAEGPAGSSDTVVALSARRPRWRTIAAAAAAVVVVAGASATAVGVLRTSSSSWQQHSATSGSVHMRVATDSQATGTALRVTVSGLPTEEHCRLIAVADDGSTDLVGQWDATYAGEAQVTGSTSIESAHLAKLVLLGNGGHALVTVPV
ncbi:MAG TPA: zf-HC2 domain-containing protein [Mycobacteriales bacterium]|nr:zf-HC2 domain-containing protein [Mycobacteriales bacterium]